jgi:hypothetical protein
MQLSHATRETKLYTMEKPSDETHTSKIHAGFKYLILPWQITAAKRVPVGRMEQN